MNLLEIVSFFEEGKFPQAIDLLLSQYQPGGEERKSGEACMEAARFWQQHAERLDQEEHPWKLWDQFVADFFCQLYPSAVQALEALGRFVMKKIYCRLSGKPVLPQDQNPFQKKLAFARSLIWTGQLSDAGAFIANLTRHYPKKPEPWALMGKLYFTGKNYPKSLLCYRESFFINPSVLNLMDIHSGITDQLLAYSRENFLREQDLLSCGNLLQWMGISGVTGNFFTAKRELAPDEIQELKKRIEVYENKYRIYKNKEDWLNLIRLYVFQIDYFWTQNKREVIQDSLEKLEWLEPMVLKKIKNTRG